MPDTNIMTDRILEIFKMVIPCLSDQGREKLLSFGEGMLLMIQNSKLGDSGPTT